MSKMRLVILLLGVGLASPITTADASSSDIFRRDVSTTEPDLTVPDAVPLNEFNPDIAALVE